MGNGSKPGPIVKYKAAGKSKRAMYLTPQFREKHDEITKILEGCASRNNQRMKMLKTSQDLFDAQI